MRIAIILLALAGAHVFFHINLASPVLFPLAASFVLSTLPYRVAALFSLGIVSEFFSSLPPGALFTAVMVPLLFQMVAKKLTPTFSWVFFALTTLITACQVALLASASFIRFGLEGIALPGIIWVFLGTTLASFLGAAVWHEYE